MLFDLDGTLVDSERQTAEAMARVLLRDHGIACSQTERDYIVGRSWVDIHTRLRADHPSMTWSMTQLIDAVARERECFFAETGMTVMPGAGTVIDRFAHLPCALVTGSSRIEARQCLVAIDRLHAFPVIFAAEDVPSSKPDPAGYLAAAAALRVAPEDCLVIEESAPGIAAGIAAGARVVAVRAGNFNCQDQSAAHFVIDTLDDLTLELAASLVP
jgi:HAD superfamily hydrolase (TIGR01509 family)